MTLRQKFLKAVYPLFVWSKKKTAAKFTNEKATPAVSFYSLTSTLNNGSSFSFEQLKGKKVLLVNTASNCGYTGQYDELQKLHEQYADKLVILGFPANDFKEQEKGSDEEIAQFCKINFGVTFPLMKKSTVLKTADQNEVYKWLSDSTKNGWNNKAPSWNFSKYLISEDGKLLNYFDPAVSPLGKEIVDQLQ
ncbi:MAG: glutathione peroxidase [Chitinophagaceae bacterium]|nr:glutathione peroxidase [Chitinophagaceae bacterium]